MCVYTVYIKALWTKHGCTPENAGGHILHPVRDVSVAGRHLGDVRVQDQGRREWAGRPHRVPQVLCSHVLQSAR